MIVTDHFVYIHTSRTAGTFLNKLILEHVPGARMLQYHGQLLDLPGEYAHLPVIGFVRNPWDWYVSMYFDYKRKQQYIFQIISKGGDLGFEKTVARFLRLGDKSILSKKLLNQLVHAAPSVINAQTPRSLGNPGLRSDHFVNYPDNFGYCSWLLRLMYQSRKRHTVHLGRFEDLREEALRLLTITGTPMTDVITSYLRESEVQNKSPRPKDFTDSYPAELEQLVAEKDKILIDQFGYKFLMARKYPKAEDFRNLGSVDINALLGRVKNIPESQWDAENEDKPNKFARLNDTRHIVFRFHDKGNAYNFHDQPLWDEWKDVLLPIMELAANRLGYKEYRFPRAMLARLPAGGEISVHTDRKASHYIHKCHVPLTTNPETLFYIEGKGMHLPLGEITEVNNGLNHSVKNDGERDRIHLIFECYNTDDHGKGE
jgi:hypothetical protein